MSALREIQQEAEEAQRRYEQGAGPTPDGTDTETEEQDKTKIVPHHMQSADDRIVKDNCRPITAPTSVTKVREESPDPKVSFLMKKFKVESGHFIVGK